MGLAAVLAEKLRPAAGPEEEALLRQLDGVVAEAAGALQQQNPSSAWNELIPGDPDTTLPALRVGSIRQIDGQAVKTAYLLSREPALAQVRKLLGSQRQEFSIKGVMAQGRRRTLVVVGEEHRVQFGQLLNDLYKMWDRVVVSVSIHNHPDASGFPSKGDFDLLEENRKNWPEAAKGQRNFICESGASPHRFFEYGLKEEAASGRIQVRIWRRRPLLGKRSSDDPDAVRHLKQTFGWHVTEIAAPPSTYIYTPPLRDLKKLFDRRRALRVEISDGKRWVAWDSRVSLDSILSGFVRRSPPQGSSAGLEENAEALGWVLLDPLRDPKERGDSAWQLALIGTPAARAFLRQALGDPQEKIPGEAVLALGWCGDDDDSPALLKVLRGGPSDRLRLRAALALGTLHYERLEQAREVLAALREQADGPLAHLKDHPVGPGLWNRLVWAIEHVEAQSQRIWWESEILSELASPKQRMEAAGRLGEIRDARCVKTLTRAFNENDGAPEVQKAILSALLQHALPPDVDENVTLGICVLTAGGHLGPFRDRAVDFTYGVASGEIPADSSVEEFARSQRAFLVQAAHRQAREALERVQASWEALTAGRELRWQVVGPSAVGGYPALEALLSLQPKGIRLDQGKDKSRFLAAELAREKVRDVVYYGNMAEFTYFVEAADFHGIWTGTEPVQPGSEDFAVFLRRLLENLLMLDSKQMEAWAAERGVDLDRLAVDLKLAGEA